VIDSHKPTCRYKSGQKFLEARFFWPNFRVKPTIRELGRFVNTAVSREHNRANAMAGILSLVRLLR
jgi:hypothetical protein